MELQFSVNLKHFFNKKAKEFTYFQTFTDPAIKQDNN